MGVGIRCRHGMGRLADFLEQETAQNRKLYRNHYT